LPDSNTYDIKLQFEAPASGKVLQEERHEGTSVASHRMGGSGCGCACAAVSAVRPGNGAQAADAVSVRPAAKACRICGTALSDRRLVSVGWVHPYYPVGERRSGRGTCVGALAAHTKSHVPRPAVSQVGNRLWV